MRKEAVTRLNALLPMLTDVQLERLLQTARDMAMDTAARIGKGYNDNDRRGIQAGNQDIDQGPAGGSAE